MKELWKKRRERLIQSWKAPAIVVLYSGEPPMRSADEEYPFSVDRNFYYLTGLNARGMILVLKKISDTKIEEELYVEPLDDLVMKWEGRQSDQYAASDRSGITAVYSTDKFTERFHAAIQRVRGEGTLKVGLDLWKYKKDQAATCAHKLSQLLCSDYPHVKIVDMYDKMVRQRLVKAKEEVDCIKTAIQTTGKAVCAMMSYARPGMNECELEGAFDFQLRKQGVRETAFPTIVAGGNRATVLHYRDNNQEVKDGELVLIDLGSTSGYYCADISRTFPINGRFTSGQKKLYNIVLEAQELVIRSARPGKTLKELDDLVRNFYAKRLEREGYLKDGRTVEDFYYHGVSHHLGLDTHDIYCPSYAKLKKDMVITVEPGLYDWKTGIGVRIEDDIRITSDGCENLSAGIPKTVEEIERLMNTK